MHWFTCTFLDVYPLKRACWIKSFYSVPSLPSSIFLDWSNKQCLCRSKLQIPSSVQACGGKCVVECMKGACRFFETSWKELPGFVYFWNSGPLVGVRYLNVWPGIPLKIWPRFCCLGVESERYICGSQLERKTTWVRWSRESRKITCDGLESCRHRQPACLCAGLPKPGGWGFGAETDGWTRLIMCLHLAM